MRGGRMTRGTITVIGWTRRIRLHAASIYNSHEGDVAHEQNTREVFEQWQAYLAEIANVPWITGGDWNIEPREAEHHWDRSPAKLRDLGAATQKHGRNIHWVIANSRTPTWNAEGIVVAGTEHVGVQVRLEAVDANTLGTRIKRPAQKTPETAEQARGETWTEWEQRTNATEEGLLTSLGITRQGAAWGGESGMRGKHSADRKMGSMASARTRPTGEHD